MSSLPLVILAAGRGSRFGGDKQLAEVGPAGEVLMAYTCFDAAAAGCDSIVTITREELRTSIERALASVLEPLGLELSIVTQQYERGAWGTGRAVLSAGTVIDGPFAVANGDDWYGAATLGQVAAALLDPGADGATHFGVAYPVERTLDVVDGVSRARCVVADGGRLAGLEELRDVRRVADRVVASSAGGARTTIRTGDLVSMNLWGFRSSIFEHLERLARQIGDAELFLPTAVHDLVTTGSIQVELLSADDSAFGLTRPEDLPRVRARIADLVASGLYPPDLRSGRA